MVVVLLLHIFGAEFEMINDICGLGVNRTGHRGLGVKDLTRSARQNIWIARLLGATQIGLRSCVVAIYLRRTLSAPSSESAGSISWTRDERHKRHLSPRYKVQIARAMERMCGNLACPITRPSTPASTRHSMGLSTWLHETRVSGCRCGELHPVEFRDEESLCFLMAPCASAQASSSYSDP